MKEKIKPEQIPIHNLIRAATLAPSGHNTQPWRFEVEGSSIRVLPDFGRRLPVVDPDDRELFISLGCAVENLVIAAEAHGLKSRVIYEIAPPRNASILLRLSKDVTAGDQTLYSAIPIRRTNRRLYNGNPIPPNHLKQLSDVKLDTDVGVKLLVLPSEREPIEELILRGDKFQFGDPMFKAELAKWVRFNQHEMNKHHDGLSPESTGNPSVPRWLGNMFLRLRSPNSQAVKDKKLLESSSALAIIWSQEDSLHNWILAGQLFERFALTATNLGIQHAHMNQAVEVPDVRFLLRSFPILEENWPQLILRLGYADSPPATERRDLDKVLNIH